MINRLNSKCIAYGMAMNVKKTKVMVMSREGNGQFEIKKRMHTELHFRKDMWRRKMEFAGHILRGSSGNSHLCILKGKVCGKRLRGRPRLTWTDDIMKWTNLKNFGVIKRVAEDRDKRRTIIVNLLLEVDE